MENTCRKQPSALFSLQEVTTSFTNQGFVTKYFLIFIVDEVKNFAANIFKLLELVTYQDPCIICQSHTRDKGFVLYLKLLFTIVNCFSVSFSPRFFTVKLVCFTGFPLVIISCLIYYFVVHDIDIILMFVCFNKVYS